MSTSTLSVDDFRRVLRKAAGAGYPTGPDFLDTTFEDLGYDSLALLETASEIQREYGVRLTDDLIATATRPRDFLALINEAIAASR
jgi:act minimal PKS acyl carrier protein